MGYKREPPKTDVQNIVGVPNKEESQKTLIALSCLPFFLFPLFFFPFLVFPFFFLRHTFHLHSLWVKEATETYQCFKRFCTSVVEKHNQNKCLLRRARGFVSHS
jgi:hypothetical protein